MSRKDSKGMFANVLGQMKEGAAAQPPGSAVKAAPETKSQDSRPTTSPHLARVAAGVRHIQERSEIADRVLKDGGAIIELDPEAIDPSLISDRFAGAYDDAAIGELVASMEERGQIVPGLVRPVAGKAGRYQIVYGRRRLAAAKRLKVKFRAIIRELSDEEAVVFQGEENSARNDLTFIEKCSFAAALEKAGFSRATISSALSTGKSHISEMIRVSSTLSDALVELIGAAPEIGRRRWLELVDKWNEHPHAHDMVVEVLRDAGKDLTSEERYSLALSSMFKKPTGTVQKVEGPERQEVHSKGMKLADIVYSKSGAKMSFGRAVPAEFVAYLAGQIENIHDAYLKEMSSGSKKNRS